MAASASCSASFSPLCPRALPSPILPHSPLIPISALSFPIRLGTDQLNRVRTAPFRLSVCCMVEPKVQVVTNNSWERMILKSETPVLVEFYASWCGPCRMVHRLIDEIAMEYAGRIQCFVLNTDDDHQIAEDYEIKAVPVVLLFKNGKNFESVVGTMPKDFYVAAIERVLKQ